jgi:hypothetical protein
LLGLAYRLGVPDKLVETAQAAVQMVRAIIRRQPIGIAVKGEESASDSIGVTPGDTAKEGICAGRRGLQISGEIWESERDVGKLTVAIRNPHGADDPTVAQDLDADSVVVRERETVYSTSIDVAGWLLRNLNHLTTLPSVSSPQLSFSD